MVCVKKEERRKERNCIQCNKTILSSFAEKFCSPKCALTWRNLHDPSLRKKLIETHKNLKKRIEKELIEELYLKKGLTQEEIAKELNVSRSTIKDRFKFYRIKARKKLMEKSKKLIGEKNREWTKEKCLKEFGELVKKLGRTPMSKELYELDKEDLRHAIFRLWGDYSSFLYEGKFGLPIPVLGNSRRKNFSLLASEAAIRYKQNGEWSSSELKLKKILDELGLVEKLDYWHNFKILSPLKGEYKLDFFLPRIGLVIECDSFWHDIGESPERDKLRDQWIEEKLRCETLRFRSFSLEGLREIREILKGRIKND